MDRGEGKFKAVLKKVGRFREGDVRNSPEERRDRAYVAIVEGADTQLKPLL